MDNQTLYTLGAAIFGAGGTWGLLRSRAAHTQAVATDLVKKLEVLLKDLSELTADVRVIKTVSTRVEAQLDHHDERLSKLEQEIARLQVQISQ